MGFEKPPHERRDEVGAREGERWHQRKGKREGPTLAEHTPNLRERGIAHPHSKSASGQYRKRKREREMRAEQHAGIDRKRAGGEQRVEHEREDEPAAISHAYTPSDAAHEKPREREDRGAYRENIGPYLRKRGKAARIGRERIGREDPRGGGGRRNVLCGWWRARHRRGQPNRRTHEENFKERQFAEAGAAERGAPGEDAALSITARTEREEQQRLGKAQLAVWMGEEFTDGAQAREDREESRDREGDPRDEGERGEAPDRAAHCRLVSRLKGGKKLEHE